MAVGVIVGGAFTAIVNGMSNFVLKPVINWILSLVLGKDSLANMYTYLTKVEVDGVIDLANSIFIDWGSLINAIINFFLTALVLFCIVRAINKVKENNEKFKKEFARKHIDRNERRELKKAGISVRNKKAVEEYFAEKDRLASQKAEEERIIQEQKALEEKLANPSTEDLLKSIKELLEKNLAK